MTTCIQFSGGKDSLACLYLYEERWNEIIVCWVNTGAAYPSVVEYMNRWRDRLPNFVEINSNQPGQISAAGYPADVVPLRYTEQGVLYGMAQRPMVQSAFDCCGANIWLPMQHMMHQLGVTEIVRGQRNDDPRQGPVRDGYSFQGITYRLPIADWSEAQVFDYLKKIGADMPPSYAQGEKVSRDCWNCTAYLDENQNRIQNLPELQRAEVRTRIADINSMILSEMRDGLSIVGH